MLIPRQVYFDEEMWQIYSDYAHQERRSFASLVREILLKEIPFVKRRLFSENKTEQGLLSFYGTAKSPFARKFNPRHEKLAFVKAMAKNAAKEGQR